MNPEHADLCRSVDPAELGRRIRQARLAAGLTQAQLAGDDVSTAYISRIEDGQRRPDPAVLEVMADRLGTPIEVLLLGRTADELRELQVLVDQAEFELASGETQAALATAEKLLGELGDGGANDLHRAASRVRAAALEATGQVDAAIACLETLAQHPTADAAWLKGLIALSRCYRERGDLDRAIAVGQDASATVRRLGLADTTEAIQLTVTVANAYMYRGDEAYALRLCKRAIDDGDRLDLPIATASGYWNASIIEGRRGRPERALFLAGEALALFEQSDDSRNIARLRAQVAFFMLLTDPPDASGCVELLDQVDRELAWSPGSTFDRANHLETKSRAQFLLGDHARALAHVGEYIEIAPDESPRLHACSFALRGRIEAAEGRTEAAMSHYRAAAQTLTGMGADLDAAQLWFELGGLLAAIGHTDGARDAFKRAAASNGVRSTAIKPLPIS